MEESAASSDGTTELGSKNSGNPNLTLTIPINNTFHVSHFHDHNPPVVENSLKPPSLRLVIDPQVGEIEVETIVALRI